MKSNRIIFCPTERSVKVVPNENMCVIPKQKQKPKGEIEISATIPSQIIVKTNYTKKTQQFDEFFMNTFGEINGMSITQKDKSRFFVLFENFVGEIGQLFKSKVESMESSGCFDQKCKVEICASVDDVSNHVKQKCALVNTSYKREKYLRKIPSFVPPTEKAIGLKWKTVTKSHCNLPNDIIIQPTFQYVSIIDQLNAFFSDPKNAQLYLEYNEHNKHVCEEGVYKDFCCSSIYKNKAIYSDATTIQIQIGVDDFDPCDPVKTKAGLHKLNAVYFIINNLPKKILSKNNSTFLISLCEATNLKQEHFNFDEIAVLILNELRKLETDGIQIGGRTVKGTLIHITADNLGANGTLGFVESFNSYFCRACEISKKDSQHTVKEEYSKMRSKESYLNGVDAANEYMASGKKIDYRATKGVKRASCFNQLKFYHTVDNITFDIMHDVFEGCAPFLLQTVFESIVKKKFLNNEQIVTRIRDHHYGSLNKRNKPSLVNFDKKNLGQNATQMRCLLLHVPFIFADLREKLEEEWFAIETFLRCVEIICSHTITDADIDTLEILLESHLKKLIDQFEVNLIPKHHFLTHYPNAIRRMGPLIFFWMMRFESKHQYFTRIAKSTKNFVNIAKTLAKRHQDMICFHNFAFESIERSKLIKFQKTSSFDKYKEYVTKLLDSETPVNLNVLQFARLNSYEYREGLFIINREMFFKIRLIFYEKEKILLFCQAYRAIQVDSFYNSIHIEELPVNLDNFGIFDASALENPKSYEQKISENKILIICDTLDVSNVMRT